MPCILLVSLYTNSTLEYLFFKISSFYFYCLDEAVICTNPEISSCRDSDKMVGFIASNSLRAAKEQKPVRQTLLVTRYDADRAEKEESLRLDDITDLLGLPLVGVIPESSSVLTSANMGQPVIMGTDNAAIAYKDVVSRLLGETVDMKFVAAEPKGFFAKLFGNK